MTNYVLILSKRIYLLNSQSKKIIKRMDFQARVIQFIGETTGVSKAGNPWKKKEWVVETFGNYPKKIKVQCFGDRADSINLEQGKDYVIYVDLESREFNGRWYTDVSVYRADEVTNQGGTSMGQPQMPGNYNNGGFQTPPQPNYPQGPYGDPNGGFQQPTNFQVGESDEDLPF